MRAYERGDERWEVELAGLVIVTRSFIGSRLEKEQREQREHPMRAKWDVDRLCAERVAEGFVCVEGELTRGLSESVLEAALLADPSDLETSMVYGDWLAERGDVWGELINLQCTRASLPEPISRDDRDRFERLQALLLFKHSARFWGLLGETVADAATQVYACDFVDVTWSLGFAVSATITQMTDFRSVPLPQYINTIAELSIMRHLRRLRINDTVLDPAAFVALGEHQWPLLESIEVTNEGQFHGRGAPFEASELSLSLGGDNAPKLRHLAVSGAGDVDELCVRVARSPIAHRLASVRITSGDFGERGVAAVESGPWDALEELQLSGSGLEDARDRLGHCAANVRIDNN